MIAENSTHPCRGIYEKRCSSTEKAGAARGKRAAEAPGNPEEELPDVFSKEAAERSLKMIGAGTPDDPKT
ncbi:hypothetical protein A7X67_18025 [Clostridium sp. W14A]|nr:hypothetical protein A7X67_18025 [Clostridium sp. W14A]